MTTGGSGSLTVLSSFLHVMSNLSVESVGGTWVAEVLGGSTPSQNTLTVTVADWSNNPSNDPSVSVDLTLNSNVSEPQAPGFGV